MDPTGQTGKNASREQQQAEGLQAVMAEIISIVNETVASGEQLDDDTMTAVANVIETITQRILQLRLTVPVATPPLDEAPFLSSNINSFKYDPKKRRLFVKFMGPKTANSGPTYRYEGVPEFIYEVFRRGAVGPKTTGKNQYHAWHRGVLPSLGAAMHWLIKSGGYPTTKIN